MQNDMSKTPASHKSTKVDRERHEDAYHTGHGTCTNCASLMTRITRLEKQSEVATQLFARLIETSREKDKSTPPEQIDTSVVAANKNGQSSRGEAPPTFDDLQEFFDFIEAEQAQQRHAIDRLQDRMNMFVEPIATLRRDVDSLFAWQQSVIEEEDQKKKQKETQAKLEKKTRVAYTDAWKVDTRPKSQ
jgi:hypothetical protein